MTLGITCPNITCIQVSRVTEQSNSTQTYAWIKSYTQNMCTITFRLNNAGSVFLFVQGY